ncbi:MAG: hypothetical protein CL840_01975 [Crocinitomicaceae bacterium]|nr:hypothetical protein [Crocinitomicaceae bacterium]|tara:strand:- start:3 stop:1682 length:1680 start_codon:yes stop_codon:yes gene_type:complete
MDNVKVSFVYKYFWRWTGLSIILGVVIFFPSIQYDYLINYDDGPLIVNNPVVQNFDVPGMFSKFVFGLYHPITTLSFAIDNWLFNGMASGFHFSNILLHFINAILCYVLAFRLSKKELIAGIVMVLFVIHPMHVESVAWLSERKDLLYTLFFLIACISYLKSLDTEAKTKWSLITFTCFVLAALSKSAAVVFPLVILLIDYVRNQFSLPKSLIRIIPYVLVSLVIGYINILAQNSAGFIQSIPEYSLLERFLLFSYSSAYYVVSFVLPIDLSPKHFYPIIVDDYLHWTYYLSPLFVMGFLVIAWKAVNHNRKYLFPIGFFVVTIVLVLKIIPTGNDLVSDRYSYLPYLGLCLLVGQLVDAYWKKSKIFLMGIGAILMLVFTYSSYSYVSVWKNEISIWNWVINKNPHYTTGYAERGRNYLDRGKLNKALKDLNRAIELDSLNSIAFNHRGLSLASLNKPENAYNNFTRAISIDSNYASAYSNRGVLLSKYNRTEEGILDLKKAIELAPKDADHYNNLGIAYAQIQNWELAQINFEECLKLNPDHKDGNKNMNRLRGMVK